MDGPDIERLYYSTKEVSKICHVKPFTIRAWENRFNFIRPNKTKSGRKQYRPKDLEIIKQVKKFIENGYDDEKIIAVFREQKNDYVLHYENQKIEKSNQYKHHPISTRNDRIINTVKDVLQEILKILNRT